MTNPEDDLLGENLRKALRASEEGLESSARDFLRRLEERRAPGRAFPWARLTLAASLLACVAVFALVLRPSPDPGGAPAQEKKGAAAGPSPDDIARLEKALEAAATEEERQRIRASLEEMRRKLARPKPAKEPRDEPAPKKKPDFTLERLTAEIEAKPDQAPLYMMRAEEYLKRKAWTEALVDAKKAVSLSPEDPKAHFVLGKVLHLMGRAEEAEPVFAQAVKLRPDLEAAIRDVRASTGAPVKKKKLEPADERAAAIQKELEGLYARMKESKNADEMERLKAKVAELSQELKLLSQGKGQVDLKAVELRLQKNPDDPEALVDRAAWHLEGGKAAPALKDLDRAIELKPGLARAYLKRAVAHAFAGDFPRAWQDARRGEELDRTAAKEINETYGAIKKLQGGKQGRQASAAELRQQIETLKERLEELRGAEADRVRAEIDRLTAELEARPADPPSKKK